MKPRAFAASTRFEQFLVARVRFSQEQIFANRAVEQKTFLCHHADRFAQRAQSEIANRFAIDRDFAGGEFVKTREQIHQRRFPAPVAPTSATVSPGRA